MKGGMQRNETIIVKKKDLNKIMNSRFFHNGKLKIYSQKESYF